MESGLVLVMVARLPLEEAVGVLVREAIRQWEVADLAMAEVVQLQGEVATSPAIVGLEEGSVMKEEVAEMLVKVANTMEEEK